MMKKFVLVMALVALVVPKSALAQEPACNANVCGSLEQLPMSAGAIYVWASDPVNPNDSLVVEVYAQLDSMPLSFFRLVSKKTDVVRPDVSAFLHSSTPHALGVFVPDSVKIASAGLRVTIMAFAVIGSNYYALPNSPRHTAYPVFGRGPKVAATLRTSSGRFLPQGSFAWLSKLDQFGRYGFYAGQDWMSVNAQIIDSSLAIWHRFDENSNLLPLECGQYQLIVMTPKGATAFKEFPLCGGDVDLGTITLDEFSVDLQVVDFEAGDDGKITISLAANNKAVGKNVEVYAVISAPGQNAPGVVFEYTRRDLAVGGSNVDLPITVPPDVPYGVGDVTVNVYAVEKGKPFKILGRQSFFVNRTR